MRNISGIYRSLNQAEKNGEEGIAEISIDNLKDNIIAIEFRYEGDVLRLTGVLNDEKDFIHIYISEKYTEKYFIQGINLKIFNKSGVHGCYDLRKNLLHLHIIINQFNKHAVEVVFEGKNEGGIYPEKNLREMRFFYSG
ncbi:MAG: hypothetical protein WBA74_12840 [Cyclobacteriaceae bacterium]